MKVLLINPPPVRHAEMHDLPDHPHIGIGYLAAILEKNGVEVSVLDAKLSRFNFDQTLSKIKSVNPDIVGISAYTHDIVASSNLAKEIKEQNPNTKILIGGVHATAIPKKTLKEFPAFDFAAIGEAENLIYDLVKAINGQKSFKDLKALAYRESNEIIVKSERNAPTNLDELPFPAWHLFPRAKEYHIMTARGCPYRCVFCMSPYGRNKIRERSPKDSIKELELNINRYNPEIYKFNDETFGFNKKRALELLDLIISKGLQKTPKLASMRANLVDREILQKMKEAGFTYIDYGVESGDPEILKIIKKGVTLEQTETAIKLTKEVGIKVGANYILGHPYDTLQTMKKTLDYAVKLNADVNAIGLMVPYPGTEIAEIVKQGKGNYKLLSNNWSDYNKQLGGALEMNDVSRKKMEKLQLKGYVDIYLKNKRYKDFAKFCWDYRRAAVAFAKNFVKKK